MIAKDQLQPVFIWAYGSHLQIFTTKTGFELFISPQLCDCVSYILLSSTINYLFILKDIACWPEIQLRTEMHIVWKGILLTKQYERNYTIIFLTTIKCITHMKTLYVFSVCLFSTLKDVCSGYGLETCYFFFFLRNQGNIFQKQNVVEALVYFKMIVWFVKVKENKRQKTLFADKCDYYRIKNTNLRNWTCRGKFTNSKQYDWRVYRDINFGNRHIQCVS